MSVKSITLAALTLIFSASSHAALIDIDWQTPGDGLILRDTSSGLDFLDRISQTQ